MNSLTDLKAYRAACPDLNEAFGDGAQIPRGDIRDEKSSKEIRTLKL